MTTDNSDALVPDYDGPVRVVVTRADTGEVLRNEVVSNDYLIICNGIRYVKSYQIWGRTHQINIGVREAAAIRGEGK